MKQGRGRLQCLRQLPKWNITDLINIVLVFVNAPVIVIGARYVYLALKDYVQYHGERFVASRIGLESQVWKDNQQDK